MKNVLLLTFLFVSLCWLQATAQIAPDITVAIDGSGDFTTLQAAIDAVPANNDKQTIIYIKRGLYKTEKLLVPANKKNVYLIGESREETIISYHIYDCATGKCPTEDAALWTGDVIRTSATLTVYGDGFRAENLTIRNTAGPVGQALAITIISDKNIFVNCNIEGYQDTIYLWISGKRSYFKNCLVVGRTDYIYGAGIGFFQGCEIRSWGGGWITAPSTPLTQPYGYVFQECKLTYALGSPRAGDDGAKVALGRPWHEYPKVAWLYCDMTDMIDPLGWPTTWNMDYAATSPDLHLYEYGNTGGGADMSGRSNWVGIRALTEQEAAEYTIDKVFGGWDPTAQAPLVNTYVWSGGGTSNNWLLADNWDPSGIPATGESATVNGEHQVNANGGIFEADLALKNGAVLNVTANSTVTYLTLEGAEVHAATVASLSGKISTKASSNFIVSGTLSLNANIIGVHAMSKKGSGKLLLTTSNPDFLGNWLLMEGTLEATAANALGKGAIDVNNGATLSIGVSNAIQPTSALKVVSGSELILNANITLNEFYINGVLQPVGEYTSSTNPGLISGTGSILVGRPSQFTFIGGTNGNWDVPAHFLPALMPEAGETVIVGREIETTATVFPADMIVNSPGRVRLRGVHKATGEITLNTGVMISYATGGAGFTLDAPITIAGNVQFDMNSSNVAGSAMTLPGRIKGSAKITAHNSRNIANSATVKLNGDNSEFTGTWDLTKAPANAEAVSAFEGLSANAFGNGKIEVGLANKVIFSHAEAAGTILNLSISGQGKAVLNTHVNVQSFILNGETMPAGTYTKITHPDIFDGEGSLVVATAGDPTPGISVSLSSLPAFAQTAETPSVAQSYSVSATGLTGDITIMPPANFEISLDENNWFTNTNPLIISSVNGVVGSSTIHARLNATVAGSYSGNIVHTTSGIDPVLITVSGSTESAVPVGAWTIYEADVMPNAFTPVFTASQQTGIFSNEIIPDPDKEGNNLLRMTTTDNGDATNDSNQWRQALSDGLQSVTVVIKAKGNDSEKDMVFDIDLDHGGYRWSMRILPNGTFTIAVGSAAESTSMGINPLEWNAYRFTKSGQHVSVYLNESTTPFYTGTGNASSGSYFRFGDGWGSTGGIGKTINTDFDWLAWDVTGAFSPAQTKLPESLLSEEEEVPSAGIQLPVTSLTAFSQTVGAPASAQKYSVSGSNLTGDITVTAPEAFEVSADNGLTWFNNATPLVLKAKDGSVSTTIIKARLNAGSAGSHSGNIVHESAGVAAAHVAVTGVTVNEERQLAFPGAEGGGRFAAGGRGGAVYEVTNLNDSGAGSLRDAVSQPNRTVVFRVSGVIQLKSRLSIKQNNITIAGQTAPGDGITITGYTLNISASNIIIRYIRCRFSDVSGAEDDAMNSFKGNYENIIIDHCSLSWSVDETGTFYDIKNFTLQWCLLSESLYNSKHDKGAHGYGGIWGGNNATFHHNLLAHHTSRNPRFGGSRSTGKPEEEVVDFRNNVIYNWAGNSAYGGEGGHYNMVNNYYKPGPATPGNLSTSSATNKKNRILQYTSYYYGSDAAVYPDTLFGGHFYIDGNYVHGYPDVTADNWTKGVQRDNYSKATQLIAAARRHQPFATAPVTTESAEEAFTSVLANVGAILPKRDAIDERIVSEVRNGNATFEGSTYGAINGTGISHPSGIIDSQTDVGGLPVYTSTTAPVDSDHDGMPDSWENEHGLNPNDASDRNGIGQNGYTNLENYLNSITGTEEEPQPQPEILVIGSIATFEQKLGAPSDVKSYTVSGHNLNGDITITPPLHFEVSDNGVYWNNSSTPLVLTAASGAVASTQILVRLNATSAGEFGGDLVHASSGATSVILGVSGIMSTVTGLDKNADRLLSVSPNPATSLLNIQHPGLKKDLDLNAVIFVYNLMGAKMNVNVVETNRTATVIDISSYPAGMYYLEYWLKNERLQVRFIKE